MIRLPRRILADWTPDAGDVEDWLAEWAKAGWAPEHPWGGVKVLVNGQPIDRWAMIAREPLAS